MKKENQLSFPDFPSKDRIVNKKAHHAFVVKSLTDVELKTLLLLGGIKDEIQPSNQAIMLVLRQGYTTEYASQQTGARPADVRRKYANLLKGVEMAKQICHLRLPQYWE